MTAFHPKEYTKRRGMEVRFRVSTGMSRMADMDAKRALLCLSKGVLLGQSNHSTVAQRTAPSPHKVICNLAKPDLQD